MSVWIKTEDKMPPLNEEVLILYKDKKDELKEDNLYYAIARRFLNTCFGGSGWEEWSRYTEYQSYYEVVFWTPLVDMPSKLINEDETKEQNNE